MRILVVEDNAGLVANLFQYFESRGHVLDAAPDGVTGLHLAVRNDYDVIVLDWMLPRLDGPSVLRKLRTETTRRTPVLMLTARGELADKLEGFQAGAEDYLSKPFALPELEVRLQALHARSSGLLDAEAYLQVQDLRLDLRTLQVSRDGTWIKLYPACRKILEVLMRAAPAVVSRERLESELWGDSPPDKDLLRSHIYELRRAVDAPFPQKMIHTVARAGFRIGASHAVP